MEKSAKRLLCFGHRGAAGHAPENTIAAVEKGISLGADFIEVDVFQVEDELVVIHDERLERTTNGTGYVTAHSLTYLRQLDAGSGQQIPLLREVFDAVNRRAGINVELKGPGTAQPVAGLIREYLEDGWHPENFLVSSFNHRELQFFKRLMPDIRIGALIVGIPLHYAYLAEELNAFSLNTDIEFIDAALVEDAHHRGLQIYVYTVNRMEDVQRMEALGVDGVFTDFPEIVRGER